MKSIFRIYITIYNAVFSVKVATVGGIGRPQAGAGGCFPLEMLECFFVLQKIVDLLQMEIIGYTVTVELHTVKATHAVPKCTILRAKVTKFSGEAPSWWGAHTPSPNSTPSRPGATRACPSCGCPR